MRQLHNGNIPGSSIAIVVAYGEDESKGLMRRKLTFECDALKGSPASSHAPRLRPHQLVVTLPNSKAGETWLCTNPELAIFSISLAIMSEDRTRSQRPLLTQEHLKKKLEITNFDPNAILRGAQLTVVGGSYLDGQRILQDVDHVKL